MITIVEGQKTLARFAFGLPVLQRHFHHFHRYGTGVREKTHSAAAASSPPVCGTAHRLAHKDTAKHHMRHGINLRLQCAAYGCG